METDDFFTNGFTAHFAPELIFKAICNVGAWWGTIEGHADALNSEFTYHSGTTWVRFKVEEFAEPGKIAWRVIDSHLPWLADKHEWNGTTVQFNIEAGQSVSHLQMTHIGLTRQLECYENCEKGWNFYLNESLRLLVETGTGRPATGTADR